MADYLVSFEAWNETSDKIIGRGRVAVTVIDGYTTVDDIPSIIAVSILHWNRNDAHRVTIRDRKAM